MDNIQQVSSVSDDSNSNYQLTVNVSSFDSMFFLDGISAPASDGIEIDLSNNTETPDNPQISELDQQAMLLLWQSTDTFQFDWDNFKWSDHPNMEGMPDASFDWAYCGQFTHPEQTYEASLTLHFNDGEAIGFDGMLANNVRFSDAYNEIILCREQAAEVMQLDLGVVNL